MDADVVVAFVAAGASLLVAVTGLIATIVTSRHSAKTAQAIEFLKQSIATQNQVKEFTDRDLMSSLDSLKQGMQAIQNLKDTIQLVLASVKESLSSKEARLRVETARDSLLASFEAGHPHFSETERRALHRAKDRAIRVTVEINNGLENKKTASALADDVRSRLIDLRGRLTDEQNFLRDSRLDRFFLRTLPESPSHG